MVNVRDCGARGDGTGDDRAALQIAHDRAARTSDRVVVPAGLYVISGPLRWHPQIDIVGAGLDHTTIRAMAPCAAVIDSVQSGALVMGHGRIEGLTLDGAGVATHVVDLAHVAGLELTRLRLMSARQCALRMLGVVTIVVSKVKAQSSWIGVLVDKSPAGEPSRFVTFQRKCVIESNSLWGALVQDSAGIVFDDIDVENNGTPGQEGGGIGTDDLCPEGEGIGVVIRGGWFERNHGMAAIRFYPPKHATALHVVENTHIFSGARRWGIRVNGDGVLTRYDLRNVVAQGASEADISEGGPNCLRTTRHVVASATAYQTTEV